MVTSLITFISLLCLVYLFVKGAEPIQYLKSKLNIACDSQYQHPIQWFILKLVNCALCSGFWIGLIFYQTILLACLVSVGSELLYRTMNKY